MSTTRAIYNFRVHNIIDHTPQVRELKLRLESHEDFTYRAGQFVMLHVPNPEGKAFLRAYSIASDEREKKGFDLLFKFVETGKASEFVWQLKGDETLQFTGPFGRVFFQEPPTSQILMLNTGTGIAQHLSYLLSKGQAFPQVRFRMLFGVRTEADIYYQKELEALRLLLPNFTYEYVLSRPSSAWSGKKGYVQNFVTEFDFVRVPSTFYLCGNGGMIKDTKAILETHQFDKTKIWVEAFD